MGIFIRLCSRMRSESKEVVKVPRSFKLLDEYDAATGKNGKTYVTGRHQGFISYGLTSTDRDAKDALGNWTGIIVGIQGKQSGEMIYSFDVTASNSYPRTPPTVR